MKVTVRDPAALLAIQPREVAAYLRARGWQEHRRISNKGSTWIRPGQGDDGAEVLLPLDRGLLDYTGRMAELLRTLELEEQRSQLEILRDLENTSGDVIRVRLDRVDITGGSVPLEAGVSLIEGVRDMLAAAACATIAPKAYFQARRPTAATEYINKVRLGQTEQGSYVVTIVSKVPPELTTGQMRLPLGPPEDPFERKVVLTLASSLGTVREAADTAAVRGGIEAFEQGVPLGVSANLCDAISAVGRDPSVNSLDIGFAWAASRPVVQSVPRLVSFPSDTMPIIWEAGRLLRETAPREDVELRGVVVGLDRGESDVEGTVTVLGVVDAQVRRVRIVLADPEYQMAVRAHGDRLPVTCYGDFAKAGKAWFLRSPRGFRLDTDDHDE